MIQNIQQNKEITPKLPQVYVTKLGHKHKHAPNRHVTNLAIASQTKNTNIQQIKPIRIPSNNKNSP